MSTKCPPIRRLRILAIDDDDDSRFLVGRLLKYLGHDVQTAGSGEEGLAMFKGNPFDLVIVDRAMRGISGDQVAKSVKALSAGTPVFLLTGLGQIMQEEGDHPEGVDLILCKPVSREDMRAAVERVSTVAPSGDI